MSARPTPPQSPRQYKRTSPNASGGSLLWRYLTGDLVDSSPTVVNGVLYVGSWDYYVYALNASSGALLWRYQTGFVIDSSPTVVNGVVYIGSGDTYVYALTASSGALLWRYQTGNIVHSSPTVVNGVVYVASRDHYVYALTASSGALLWRYQTGAEVDSSPTVVNGVLYVGSDDYYVYALNASSGALLWRYQTGNLVKSSPTVVNGVVYIGSEDSYVYALNASSGALLWRYQTGNAVDSSPTVVNGALYIGSWDNYVYALNASTSALLWRYQTGGAVSSSITVVNSVAYVGPADSYVYALNASAGSLLWRYQTGGFGNSSPTVVNGVLYVGSHDYYVYALNTGGGTPTTVKVHGMVVEATVGQPTSLLTPYVAVFSDTNTSSTATDFSATIDWGDSTPTTSGKVSQTGWSSCQPWEPLSPNTNKCFKIDSQGEHFYKNPPLPGTLYHITVTVTKSDGQKIVPGQAFAEIVAPLGNPPNPKFNQSIGVITIRYSTADGNGATVYSCTATALADVNVILTAKHCFPRWRPTSEFVEIQFAPAHKVRLAFPHIGQCNFNQDLKQCGGNPLGVWSTTNFSDVHMATDTKESHDAAFIAMNQQSNTGEYLTDALMNHTGVPGLPVIFNALPGLSWTAYGYPTGYAKGYSPGQLTSWNLHSCGILKGNRLGSNSLGYDPNNFWISPCETLGVNKDQDIAGTSGGPWISNDWLPNGIGATNHYFCSSAKFINHQCDVLSNHADVAPPLDHTEMNLYIQAIQASGA